jgi:hypothetical protein
MTDGLNHSPHPLRASLGNGGINNAGLPTVGASNPANLQRTTFAVVEMSGTDGIRNQPFTGKNDWERDRVQTRELSNLEQSTGDTGVGFEAGF